MENTKFDFDQNIKYIIDKKIEDDIEINLQSKVLDSEAFNNNFKQIEKSLNTLYEKQRTLQDIIKYSQIYLTNEINNSIKESKTLLSAIENDRDLTKNNSYVKYTVPFNFNTSVSSTDRNNSVISNSVLYDSNLTLNNVILNRYSYDKIEINQNFMNNNLNSTIYNYGATNKYRTFYMFNGPQSSSIKEKMNLTFDKPIKINKINFSTSNCSVDKIILTLDDGSIEKIENPYAGLFKTRTIKAISLELSCTNYIISQINYNDVKDEDFWSIVEKIELDESLYIDKNKYFYYLFGIDNLEIQHVNIDDQSCFISKEIKIDDLKENEHITLDVIDSIEKGSIEYYIIDGTESIPILPESVETVIDERIFYRLPLRFNYDSTKPIIIKRNGNIVKMNLQEVINKNEDGVIYTVSYTPKDTTINKLLNNKIKIKAIIRKYHNDYSSFIKNINIKKYGGGKLWIDRI